MYVILYQFREKSFKLEAFPPKTAGHVDRPTVSCGLDKKVSRSLKDKKRISLGPEIRSEKVTARPAKEDA